MSITYVMKIPTFTIHRRFKKNVFVVGAPK